MAWSALVCVGASAQPEGGTPLRTTLCEIMKQPARFDGKLVEFRAVVDSGVQELPAGVSDESCSASLKFLTPDEEHLARLEKSGEFRKLTKAVAKRPLVEATVSGWFVREKSKSGLVLVSVKDIVAKKGKPAH